MTLGILLPSRGRPANLLRFITAVMDTATAGGWHLFVRLDEDDPALSGYTNLLRDPDPDITVGYGPRIGFAQSLNQMARIADTAGMSHVGMFGDDVVPVTPGWDAALIEALGDDLGIAYGDDGLQGKHDPSLPTHYVTQTEVYRRLGYLAPPTIRHLFLDNVARDVGRYLGNFVYVPVSLPHLHPWGEGEQINDATYREGGRNHDIRQADRKAYVRWASDSEWKRRLR